MAVVAVMAMADGNTSMAFIGIQWKVMEKLQGVFFTGPP